MLLLRNLNNTCVEMSVDMLIKHYETAKTAGTAKGNEFMKLPLITSETHTEWKTFQHYFLKEQDDDTKAQLLVINF